MTLAARSNLHAGKRQPRDCARGLWPVALKALVGGAVAVVAGTVAVTAMLTGLGWLLAGSTQARRDVRPVVRVASMDRMAWVRPVREESAYQTVAFESFPSANVAQRFGLLETGDDRIVTGSLGPDLPRRVAVQIIKRPPVLALAAAPPPLPQARPRLASLTPIDGIGLRPDMDDRRRKTAIYDITAKVVYMPDGARLEAHSGFGEWMDDPNSLRRKMRGVTPPNTYDLALRESLFHGVQAIRLKPVNEKDMFGRDGILAHSYMLGPNGQSNGCVSFRDYPKFLDAFMRGEVDRIVVVSRLDRPPALAERSKERRLAKAL